MTAPSQVPAVADVLHGLAAEHRIPGAQLAVYHRGERTTTEYGELAYRAGQPVTGATCFPVGSISKLFTATLAMILVADGDLELDEPVRDHLDPAERARLDPALTLRHLLSHTGGLPSGPSPADVRATSLRRYVQDYAQGGLAHPGTHFSYSNVGYVLTGRVIEAVTGMGWQEAVESMLLAPLGAGRADAVEWVQLGGRMARRRGRPASADVRRLIA
jgi:CubicO group peptidase (beta-lactamase class C family)